MRFSFSALLTVAVIGLVMLPGCKDSNNNDENTSVLGLWQLDSNEGDISYVNITTTTVTAYDYMGDEYDEGPDCYKIESQEILDVNGSKYTFSDPLNPNATIVVDVTANGNQLTVVQPFGSMMITLKFNKSSASISTFTPECAENQSKTPTVIF